MGRFGRVTGSFNEDYQYLDSYKNSFSEFYHEGLDLRGKTGTPVLPGQIVALAGSTGTGGGESATNVHLHLEVFNVEGLFIQTVINENSNLIWNDSFDRFNHRRDPLNNTK